MDAKEKILSDIKKAEAELHKQIDDEVKIDEEIEEVAKVTARALESKPMAHMQIENRDFLVVAALTGTVPRILTVVAREKTRIATPTSKVIKANVELDMRYTKQENLEGAIKAILGHITGRIKPEVLD